MPSASPTATLVPSTSRAAFRLAPYTVTAGSKAASERPARGRSIEAGRASLPLNVFPKCYIRHCAAAFREDFRKEIHHEKVISWAFAGLSRARLSHLLGVGGGL